MFSENALRIKLERQLLAASILDGSEKGFDPKYRDGYVQATKDAIAALDNRVEEEAEEICRYFETRSCTGKGA